MQGQNVSVIFLKEIYAFSGPFLVSCLLFWINSGNAADEVAEELSQVLFREANPHLGICWGITVIHIRVALISWHVSSFGRRTVVMAV